MTPLPDLVRKKVDPRCLTKGGVGKGGCTVNMAHAPTPRVVIDLDKPGSPLGPDEKRCDYLLVAAGGPEKNLVMVLELKHGQLDTKKAVSQLQAGAAAAEKLIPKRRKVRFRPVAVSGSRRKHARDDLRKPENRIVFHGQPEVVQLLSCGGPLTKVL